MLYEIFKAYNPIFIKYNAVVNLKKMSDWGVNFFLALFLLLNWFSYIITKYYSQPNFYSIGTKRDMGMSVTIIPDLRLFSPLSAWSGVKAYSCM